MLKKLAAVRAFFLQETVHPLADPEELRRTIEKIPGDHPFKALDEIVANLESLLTEGDIPAPRLFEATRQLDESARTPLRLIGRAYLDPTRQSRIEEMRLWAICHGFYTLLAEAYERCLVASLQKTHAGEQLKPSLALIAARLIAALGQVIKWQQFHYAAALGTIWLRLGRALNVAEATAVADRKLLLYPGLPGQTTPQQEFVKIVAFQAATMSNLLPFEIDIAERLITHFLPDIGFTARHEPGSTYWLDLNLPQPPQRCARMPKESRPGQRFFKPENCHARMTSLLGQLEQGATLPKTLLLDTLQSTEAILPVLRHLTNYLSTTPPQRSHDRHSVKQGISVVHGLSNVFIVFSAQSRQRSADLPIASWIVENASRSGFGVSLKDFPEEWLKAGALIALQQENENKWLPAIIRRYQRTNGNDTKVGIQLLAEQATTVVLHTRTAAHSTTAGSLRGLLLPGLALDEVQLVIPASHYSPEESMTLTFAGRQQSLVPIAPVEQTAEYTVARYRMQGLV